MVRPFEIFISGVHSGPNPSPGLGVARSVREAFPDCRIVGVDYSARSSGLHDPVLDAVSLRRPWAELDLALHRASIDEVCRTSPWIPCLDLELTWYFGGPIHSPSLYLAPTRAALALTTKPASRAAEVLGTRVPETVGLEESDAALAAFLRRHGPLTWLKGRHYEAFRVGSWQQFLDCRAQMEQTWGPDLLMQANVIGTEESFAFAAFEGELLGSVRMQKRLLTQEGKTWAGSVERLDGDELSALRRLCKEANWTGGGELEFVRSSRGDAFLIDFNPRFPAWVFGATLAGENLPGLLVERAIQVQSAVSECRSNHFVRVVTELPVSDETPLLPLEIHHSGLTGPGKHPSGMPQLSVRLVQKVNQASPPPFISDELLADLHAAASSAPETPTRIRLPTEATRCLALASSLASQVGEMAGVDLKIAISVKTDPDPWLLDLGRAMGLMAEVISQDEYDLVVSAGFTPGQIILNGPAPLFPRKSIANQQLFAFFADSLSLMSLAEGDTGVAARFLGARMRLPHLWSRFGIDLSRPNVWAELQTKISALPASQKLGVHFHAQASVIGATEWLRSVEALIKVAAKIQEATGRGVSCVDLGGGWAPGEAETELIPRVTSIISSARARLQDLEAVVLEPGKWLSESSAVLVARVLEVRATEEATDLVVDASIAELPEANLFPHRVLIGSGGDIVPLARGRGRVFGRICMESDVLAQGLSIPSSIAPGELVFICDAGAYDSSMSYRFGRG